MLERVPVPLPLGGISEGVAAENQEVATTPRALNMRGIDARTPGRMRLAQRSGLEPHGDGELAVGDGSALRHIFQAVRDTPPERWVEYSNTLDNLGLPTGAAVVVPEAWARETSEQPVAMTVGPDGNSYTLLENGCVVVRTSRGKMLESATIVVPVDFTLVEDIAVDEDGAVYAMAAHVRRVGGGCGRIYRFVRESDRWERQYESIIEWRPTAFEYSLGELLVLTERPEDWDTAIGEDGPASKSRMYRLAGAKAAPFVMWSKDIAHPALDVSVNDDADLYVAHPRNPERAANSAAVGTPTVSWTPREADVAGEGVEAAHGYYFHVSALRAQNVQGLVDGAFVHQWHGSRGDHGAFPEVIDDTGRWLYEFDNSGGGARAEYPPTFDSDGFLGAPGIRFQPLGTNVATCLITRINQGTHEKATALEPAPGRHTIFPAMRNTGNVGAKFVVTALIRIQGAHATARYIFDQNGYTLTYITNAGNVDLTFTMPGHGASTHTFTGTGEQTFTFTFVHAGHNVAGSFWRVNNTTVASGLTCTLPQDLGVRTVIGWTEANISGPAGSANENQAMNGWIGEIITFMGGTPATIATTSPPHGTIPGATLYEKLEGFAAWAYGRQGILSGHTYAGAPPSGAGATPFVSNGGVNNPAALTVKYSRADGMPMWVANGAAHGHGVAAAPGNKLYTASIESDTVATRAALRLWDDEGDTLETTPDWTVSTGVGDTLLGPRIRMGVDQAGDLYFPWVEADPAGTREVRRYAVEGNRLGGPFLVWSHALDTDGYPLVAIPAGTFVGENVLGAVTNWVAAGASYTLGQLQRHPTTNPRLWQCIQAHTSLGTGAVDEPLNGANYLEFWEALPCGPEFVYVAARETDETARRIDVLFREATNAPSVRSLELVGVSETGTVARYSAARWADVAATVFTGDHVWSATSYQRTIIGDGRTYRVYDHLRRTLREFEESTTGEIPPRCRLGVAWNGRVVMARGDDAHNWFMSAVDEPFNWDFTPEIVTETQATSGLDSQVGQVPDIVNALVPWSDDLLIFGCDHEIWRLTGDPMADGRLHRVTDITGMAFGQAWTKDPRGLIYFWGSRGGLYVLSPDGGLQALSEGRVHRRLQEINLEENRIRLAWNEVDGGVHCFVIPRDGVGEPFHYFFEVRTGAFWEDQFHGANHQVRGVYLSDGDTFDDRRLLLAGADGRLRVWSHTAADDDGERIRATCLIGPLTPPTSATEFRLSALEVVLARDQGGCEVAVGGTSEADYPPYLSPRYQVRPGRSGHLRLRARGSYLWAEVAGSETGQTFAVEGLAMHVAPAGRKRVRT